MISALLVERRSVVAHHPLGASTGYMVASRSDWEALVDEALTVSTVAVELAAIAEPELESLLDFLADNPRLPFRFISLHAPSKARQLPERDLIEMLDEVKNCVDAIVVHPDTIDEAKAFRRLGRTLAIENMDARKPTGRTTAELARLFDQLPEAGFCFDVAHAWSVDQSMSLAEALLDEFAQRLRHVHVSSLDEHCKHQPLSVEQERLFLPSLGRCSDVPWILEAPLQDR